MQKLTRSAELFTSQLVLLKIKLLQKCLTFSYGQVFHGFYNTLRKSRVQKRVCRVTKHVFSGTKRSKKEESYNLQAMAFGCGSKNFCPYTKFTSTYAKLLTHVYNFLFFLHIICCLQMEKKNYTISSQKFYRVLTERFNMCITSCNFL